MLHVPVFNPCSFKVPTLLPSSTSFGQWGVLFLVMNHQESFYGGLLVLFMWHMSLRVERKQPPFNLARRVIGLFSFTKGCSFFLTWTRDWGRLGQGFSVQRLAPWIAVINSRGNQCVLLSICKFTLERILGAGFSRRSKLRTLKSGWWYWSSSNHHGYWWLITSCGTKNPTKTRQSCLMMSASTK